MKKPTSGRIATDDPPRKPAEDRSKWYTRANLVDMLGVSNWTVIGWERRGKLTPQRDTRLDSAGTAREVIIYDPDEVKQLPLARVSSRVGAGRDPGEMAARAFELFDLGKSIRECVIELREMPDRVRELREKWQDGGGADLVISPLAKDALEQVVGPFSSVAELVQLVSKLAPAPTT